MSLYFRRPRFQLSLRTVFVLFLLASVSIGLAIKWRQRALLQAEVVRQLNVNTEGAAKLIFGSSSVKLIPNAHIKYDFQLSDDPVQQRLFESKPSWLSSIFGVDMIHSVKEISFLRKVGRDDLESLNRLGYITHLELYGGVAEFSDWKRLCSMDSLTNLTLFAKNSKDSPTQDSRTGNRFEHIGSLSALNELQMVQPELDSAEWTSIFQHPVLEILKLSDLGLPLPNMSLSDPAATRIRKLFLSKCKVPPETIDSILYELPNLNFLAIEPTSAELMSDQVFESISKLEKLEQLFLHRSIIKGHELNRLQKLPIRRMGLGFSNLDDRGLENIVAFKQLNYLEVGSTKITDLGMTSLAQLSSLTKLSIRDTKVTDKGFLELARIKGLKMIRIRDTDITDEGVQQFRKLLPNCSIEVR